MSTHSLRQSGLRSWRGATRSGIGLGAAAAAMLASAAVATAAPQHVPVTSAHQNQAHLAGRSARRPDSTISVRPASVTAGSRVRITGDAPTKARTGLWITVQSYAFNAKTKVNGVPAVRTRVLANGTYAVTATTRGGLKPDRYAITGSFRGQPFSQVAWLRVRGR